MTFITFIQPRQVITDEPKASRLLSWRGWIKVINVIFESINEFIRPSPTPYTTSYTLQHKDFTREKKHSFKYNWITKWEVQWEVQSWVYLIVIIKHRGDRLLNSMYVARRILKSINGHLAIYHYLNCLRFIYWWANNYILFGYFVVNIGESRTIFWRAFRRDKI